MLKIEQLHAGYGASSVLNGVSLQVGDCELVAVVGPNGAGKSTLFNAISGLVEPTSGAILLDGRDIADVPASRRAHLGIAHVPEGRQVFPSLTVFENLEVGASTEAGRRSWTQNLEKIYAWFPILFERRNQAAGNLSGGQQQMLAIGRGLASSPKLLMLDEPSMGLAPAVADEIFERIVAIHREEGFGVLLVEQRVAEALHFADRAYVLETGRIILEGDHATLRDDDRIRQAYLGL
ncbi:MAG TPA: ABC transporter ATP-binding protein [Gammaproteobacteria bacterium]|nr:ABC transporter ATP-binding protein [Gammaproteobacteria bacterium]